MTSEDHYLLPTATDAARQLVELRFEKLFQDADALSIQGYLPDGTVVYWNHASEKIYGYTVQEALGGNLLELIIPEPFRPTVAAAVRWMFETGQGIPAGRLVLQHKNGHAVPVHSSHTVVSLPGQAPILFCMDADMTALAQAEDELRIAAAAFDIQQGLLITDPQGTILRVNRAFTQNTGYTPADIIGQPLSALYSDQHAETWYAARWQDLLATGFWEGESWHRRKNGEVYADWTTFNAVRDPDGAVTHYVTALTDMTQRKQAEARIAELSFYDPLTRLPNRRLFLNRLEHALATGLRNQRRGALLLIDLDRFQTLNDTLGHAWGDRLLQSVAQRLLQHSRAADTVARLGGDEFVVMLEGLDGDPAAAAQAVQALGQQLLNALSQPYRLLDHEYAGSVSIGITLFPAGDSSVEALLKQADLAMYEAKAAGRHALRFFDTGMQTALHQRSELLGGLREGLAKHQFVLYYQPQVAADGQLVGVEALLRWQRPGHGLVTPGQFIASAEESGLILPLGAWVLEAACAQLAAWSSVPALAPLTVAVNVSMRQFQQADFVQQVLLTLAQSGANPQRLKLELTESLLIADVEGVIGKMRILRAAGIRFALDDFGTGYSSLAYLQRLPLDQLKIDQAFIRNFLSDRGSEQIVQTIIALGRSLGLAVIAEGVETEAQCQLLQQLGCETYQGYRYGRPMPAAQVLAWSGQRLDNRP